MRRRPIFCGLLAAPLLGRAAVAQAEWRPDRPIRIVVPFAPGGSTDTAARLVAEAIAGPLGQPVVVENRAGAGGTIAAEHVARSAPDGHTLFMATNTPLAAAPALYPNLPYDPARDFAAVSLVVFAPNMAAIHPSVPATTLAEFIAHARANPGRLSYGSAGAGSSQHLSAALLAHLAGLEMTHVAYRGGAPLVLDLIAGRIQLGINPVIELLPALRDGKLRPIGATTRQRAAQFPDVPAIGEILPGYEVASWAGLFAPAGTPRPAIARIAAVTVAAMGQPALRARIEELGSIPVTMGAEETARFHAAEIPKWAEIVRVSGARLE
ncbi:MAG: tripartite tricarboxylate transporter substrate binding protein [Acetobacteraceae bacterium]|nr:tripartite tricarboxylate transporter substrate binding protein [Acetobacteraceae bacterium]